MSYLSINQKIPSSKSPLSAFLKVFSLELSVWSHYLLSTCGSNFWTDPPFPHPTFTSRERDSNPPSYIYIFIFILPPSSLKFLIGQTVQNNQVNSSTVPLKIPLSSSTEFSSIFVSTKSNRHSFRQIITVTITSYLSTPTFTRHLFYTTSIQEP